MPKNDFTCKMKDFDNFTKIALKCGWFGQNNCHHRLWKVAQSAINSPIWSHYKKRRDDLTELKYPKVMDTWNSVARFGKMPSATLAIFENLWQNVVGLFCIFQNCTLTLADILCYWANLQCCKWPNLAIWSHWRHSSRVHIML